MGNLSRKLLTCFFCIWFLSASTLGAIANAQSITSDFEAPIIEHEENVAGILGDVESFVATVGDNEELKSVSLFYRYAGETEFAEVAMKPLVESSFYSASVNTATHRSQATAIEYYIRAEDKAGNVVFKGLPFNPLIRSLINVTTTVNSTVASDDENPPQESTQGRKMNWIYVALGALVVGGIAASVGGGSSDSGNTTANDDPGCALNCNVTLTLTTP